LGYKEGRARENYIKRKLIDNGWLVLRATGSAGGLPSSRVKPIDLIAMKNGRILLIQVSKRKSDITEEEIDELKRLAKIAGAEAVIAYKKGRSKGKGKDKGKRTGNGKGKVMTTASPTIVSYGGYTLEVLYPADVQAESIFNSLSIP